jgi:deoxyribose-phosphate aldolase
MIIEVRTTHVLKGELLLKMDIAGMIDHTLLKPEATKEQIKKLCEEAKEYKFASVCVNPGWVKYASELLAGTGVNVVTVIGFPLGATTLEAKVFEAKNAVENGASEVDMVINIGALKGGDNDYVEKEIRAVVDAVKGKALTKVIIEACLLTDEEKVRACELAVKAGADYVKTSTGFSTGGATVEDVKLMRKTVGPNVGVKASGGVRSAEDAKNMIEAGASRIGASSGVAIVKGLTSESDY